jgi:undecaprenyl-diphosphatase
VSFFRAVPDAVAKRILLVMAFALLIVATAWLLAPDIRAAPGNGNVRAIDRSFATWSHSRTSPTMAEFMRWVSLVQGTAGILALTALAEAVLWRSGFCRVLPLLLMTVPGGMLLNVAVKHAVHRPRPDWGYAQQALETFSFPSGHAAGPTLFYGAAVVRLWPRAGAWWPKIVLVMAAASLAAVVAASRITSWASTT